jgi:Protein of unknown function (DUF3465)
VNSNRVKNFLIVLFTLLVACERAPTQALIEDSAQAVEQYNNAAIVDAFKNKKSDIFVEGSGVVKKLLADDNKGSRHQKFLVSISPEQTLLFAHNIDLAPRVENLQIGDALTFRGEYVYNPKGGVMHWTHHDPDGGTKIGWITHNGKKYE